MFVAMRAVRILLVVVAGLAACKSHGPMSKIDAEKAALLSDDAEKIRAATTGFPSCPEQPYVAQKSIYQDTCLAEIANALGSKEGFVVTPPDNAATATAALVLLRDNRGDAFTHLDTWLNDLKTKKGTGHDALRLAVARRMAEVAPTIGKTIEGDDASRAAMKAVVSAIPGACNTYYLVGNGAPIEKMPAPLTPDHSACVQKDLKRRDGPGGMFGHGIPRALEGAVSVWREAEHALREGMSVSDDETKALLDKKLSTVIEPATRAIKTRYDDKEKALSDTLRAMQMAHDDAGIPSVPAVPVIPPSPSPSPLPSSASSR